MRGWRSSEMVSCLVQPSNVAFHPAPCSDRHHLFGECLASDVTQRGGPKLPKRQTHQKTFSLKETAFKTAVLCALGNDIDPGTQLIFVLLGKTCFFCCVGGLKTKSRRYSQVPGEWFMDDPRCLKAPAPVPSSWWNCVTRPLDTGEVLDCCVPVICYKTQGTLNTANHLPKGYPNALVWSYLIMMSRAAPRSRMLLGHDFALDGLSTLLPSFL